jgi:hypothetical protein
MPLPAFEPEIPTSEGPQTHVLDDAATRISKNIPSDTNSRKHNTNKYAEVKADIEGDSFQLSIFFYFLFSL